MSAFRTVFLGVGLLCCGLCTASVAVAQRRIELQQFQVTPHELASGEPFTISAHAETTNVKLGSFLLRTAYDVPRQYQLPGLSLYRSGHYYVSQQDQYFLADNGPRDDDPRVGFFATAFSTRGWPDGAHRLAFFASCRPASGPFVAARHDFTVVVKEGKVTIYDTGTTALSGPPALHEFQATPSTLAAGEQLRVICHFDTSQVTQLELHDPFYIPADETLGGFHYNSEKKQSYYPLPPVRKLDNSPLDGDPAAGHIALEVDASGWPPGTHHFQLDALSASRKIVDSRNFAVTVRGPHDQLKTAVSKSWFFGPGTHFGRFVKLRDGTLLCGDRFSNDAGRTWQGANQGFGVGALQLRDGRIIGFDYRCLPHNEESGAQDSGIYTMQRSVSTDNGRSFEKSTAYVHVPEATGAQGHAPHVGPLFMRSLMQRRDGSLIGLFAGWFKSDTVICPYGRGRPYSRTYVCEADQMGRHWTYLATIGYDQIGSEGYNEGSLQQLPDGRLLAVLRTGSEKDFNCQDNPIMWSESFDEGRTWSTPQDTGLEGAYPSLAVLSDGRLAVSYGRPGAMLAFSADMGRTWHDRTLVDSTPYSGYTDVVEVGPSRLLTGFGTRDYLQPSTGTRSNDLRLALVEYTQARSGSE